ncbi:hypothetical protein RRG08_022955 [Elysia crispata]|uniref:Uncharacterized protein n=1 Tax=Elysia crispata TaxID=231223 RepID=A0AAE1DXH5_9GAST|nr:hypothetical protein RRG08_022955 [Elysia crispata]
MARALLTDHQHSSNPGGMGGTTVIYAWYTGDRYGKDVRKLSHLAFTAWSVACRPAVSRVMNRRSDRSESSLVLHEMLVQVSGSQGLDLALRSALGIRGYGESRHLKTADCGLYLALLSRGKRCLLVMSTPAWGL